MCSARYSIDTIQKRSRGVHRIMPLGHLMLASVLLAIGSSRLMAQPGVPGVKLEVGAQAIGLVTRESPAIRGETFTEGYLTQPSLMTELSAFNGDVVLKGALNLEGA